MDGGLTMTQNDKELLIRDLCARLPYNVIVHLEYDENTSITREMGLGSLHDIMFDCAEGKPYLRPMSSMTEEEIIEFNNIPSTKNYTIIKDDLPWDIANYKQIDWLNAHHLDFRNLIGKNLAIAVTEDNNPYKE